MAQSTFQSKRFEVTTTATDPTDWVIPVGGLKWGGVQFVGSHGLTGTYTATVKQSIDGATPTAFSSAISTSSVPYMTTPMDLTGVGFLHVQVTSGGGSGWIEAHFVGKTD